MNSKPRIFSAMIATLGGTTLLSITPAASANDEGRNHRSFVYVITNPAGPNAVEVFARSHRSGVLRRLGRFGTGGTGDPVVAGPEQHELADDGRHLFVVNPGSNDISSMEIGEDGSLRLIGKVPSGGRRPVSLALSGDLLYVANEGSQPGEPPQGASYSGFRLRHDGELVPIPGSTIPFATLDAPEDIVFDRSGRVVIAARLAADAVDSFVVGPTGLLTNQKTIQAHGGPFGIHISNDDERLLLVDLGLPEQFPNADAPGLSLYAVSSSGDFHHIDTFTDPDKSDQGFRDPCWIATSPDERTAWVSSFIPSTLTAFSVDHRKGLKRLSVFTGRDTVQVTDPSDPVGPLVERVVGSTDITMSRDGAYLYQLRTMSARQDGIPVVPRIATLRVTEELRHQAGLVEVGKIILPDDLAGAGVMGLHIVEKQTDCD